MEEAGATGKRPPYRVDAPVHKVQTVEYDGDLAYLFRHDFTRLDTSNYRLLLQHENDTLRVTEQIAKGQFRSKNRSLPADGNLYKAIITGGGWRPAEFEEVRDKELIPDAAQDIYTLDEETGVYKPGWYSLDKATMSEFVVERQSHAIFNLLRSNGEYIAAKTGGISFMFEKAGEMRVCLNIGDPDEPAYKLLFAMRRPDSKRRTRFREDFAFGVDHQADPKNKKDLGKTEIRVDIEQGVSIFKEYFIHPIDDPEYNSIVFGNELSSDSPSGVRPYTEEDMDLFLSLFSPSHMVEASAALVSSFSKTDRESRKR